MDPRRLIACLMFAACATCALVAVACSDGQASDSTQPGPEAQAAIAPLTFIAESLPRATVDAPYHANLPLNRDARCRITAGGLPPGLSMDDAGVITGTPRVTGEWFIEVAAAAHGEEAAARFVVHVLGVLNDMELEHELRALTNQKRLIGFISTDLPELDPARVELGRMLFFDKILSGNKDVACATCHHPAHGFADGLSLSVGVGANGVTGPGRRHREGVLIPRNSPPIFYSGIMASMFWDKRVRLPLTQQGGLPPVGTPVETPEGPMPLAPDEAQVLFPLVDIIEMRGEGHELDGVGPVEYRLELVKRLRLIPEYVTLFEAAFGPDGMTVFNMARAIAAFERSQTYVNSAWDRYLLGERAAITEQQKRGALLFFGRATCDNCHNGPMLSDFTVRNIMVPQFGPGRGRGAAKGEDYGAEDTTGRIGLRYSFRTPHLRQISLTAPYMHNGAFNTLKEVVEHYRDKQASLQAFDKSRLAQAWDLDGPVADTRDLVRRRAFLFTLVPGDLSDEEVDEIVAFLETLTDPAAVNRTDTIPARLPSGLPFDG